MTMRNLFIVVLGVLTAMSVVAWLWKTDDDTAGKTRFGEMEPSMHPDGKIGQRKSKQ